HSRLFPPARRYETTRELRHAIALKVPSSRIIDFIHLTQRSELLVPCAWLSPSPVLSFPFLRAFPPNVRRRRSRSLAQLVWLCPWCAGAMSSTSRVTEQ